MSAWTEIRDKVVGLGLPILGNAILPGAGGAAGAMIAEVLGVDQEPDAIVRAIDADPDAAIKLRQVEGQERVSLRRIAAEVTVAEMLERQNALSEINQTIRAELATDDRFKSSWRPMFGYVMAFAFGWLFAVVGVVILAAAFGRDMTNTVNVVASLTGTITTLFGIGLAVLGIQIRERSRDKQTLAGMQPRSLVESLVGTKHGGA